MREPVARVYQINNKENGMYYIGVTKNSLEKRLSGHISFCRQTLYPKKPSRMKMDFQKYGEKAFSIQLLENIYDLALIEERENYWIEKLQGDKCYNTRKSTYSAMLKLYFNYNKGE